MLWCALTDGDNQDDGRGGAGERRQTKFPIDQKYVVPSHHISQTWQEKVDKVKTKSSDNEIRARTNTAGKWQVLTTASSDEVSFTNQLSSEAENLSSSDDDKQTQKLGRCTSRVALSLNLRAPTVQFLFLCSPSQLRWSPPSIQFPFSWRENSS